MIYVLDNECGIIVIDL